MRDANQGRDRDRGRYTFSSGARPLDGYTIKRAIGRGGFGEVYYATSDAGKEVALKLILRNLEVERRGVVQCMNLKCPNLLAIFDLKDSDAGDTFVIMEYVAGPSLANVLKRHPNGLPLPEARRWLKGLVEGVAYLHDHGVVHRDLKPANLFMEEGTVKIGDYGLAKLITPSQGTEHSESIGTCHYMAPEIGSGKYNKPIDIYALGVVLYEMLTGRVPFEGETVNEVLMKHLTARPDVSTLAEPYQTIVARALAKSPEQRPASAYALLPPEDAPSAPEVRIIGEGKKNGVDGGARHDQRAARPGASEEEVYRIGAEDPVFYIGPETRPPRSARCGAVGRVRAFFQDEHRARERANRIAEDIKRRIQARAQQRRAWAQRRAEWWRAHAQKANHVYGMPIGPAPAPVQSPPPPMAPPPEPSARGRFAELAASMFWAAPVLALLTVPTVILMGIKPIDDFEKLGEIAFLFGTALLGAWALLISSKVTEARRRYWPARRFVALGVGLALGAASTGLGWALDLDLNDTGENLVTVAAPLYFGLLFAVPAGSWSKLTVRHRRARFRILPVVWTGLLAALLQPLWPLEEPYGIAVAAMIAAAVQVVSPWNEAAALYARYAKVSSAGRARCC